MTKLITFEELVKEYRLVEAPRETKTYRNMFDLYIISASQLASYPENHTSKVYEAHVGEALECKIYTDYYLMGYIVTRKIIDTTIVIDDAGGGPVIIRLYNDDKTGIGIPILF